MNHTAARIADIVILHDPNIRGIVENITRHADGMTVYSIRTLDGTLFAREAEDFQPADQDATESFRENLQALAPLGDLAPELIPVKVSADGAVITRGMVEAEIARTARAQAAMQPYTGPNPKIIGLNASVNMFA